jgi:hypothetical protein
MGMDVLGLKPRSEKGKTIYGNNAWWREIADYCRLVAADGCSACKYWYSNDGDGLNDAGALALAKILRARITDHHTEDYARELAAKDKGVKEFTDLNTAIDHLINSEAEASLNFLKKIAAFADFLEDCGGNMGRRYHPGEDRQTGSRI